MSLNRITPTCSLPLEVVVGVIYSGGAREKVMDFAANKVVVQADYLASLEASQAPGFFAKLFTSKKIICSSAILGGAYLMISTGLQWRRTKWEELKHDYYVFKKMEYLGYMLGGGVLYFIGLDSWDES